MSWNSGDIIFSNQVGGSELSYTALFSTGGIPQENDLIVVVGSSSGDGVAAGTVTMPVGWTEVYQYSAVGISESAVFVFYAIADAGGSLPELTVSRTTGERHYFRALGYRNTLGAPEFQGFTIQENVAAGTSAVLAGGIAVPYNDALVITAIGSGSTTTANNISSVGIPNSADSSTSATMAKTAPDSEWTQRYNFTTSAGNDCAFATADTLITDGSTGNITWAKNTGTAKSTVVAMVFSPAGGGDPVVTNITFTGTIPDQSFTVGDTVDVDLSSYFSGSETPFTFASTGTDLSTVGLSITVSGRLQGTVSEGTVSGIIITGTDNLTNTASSNSFTIVVNPTPELVPQGAVTVGTVTVGETTASIPFSYDLSDQTGFVYRLNGGSPVSVASSPISLTSLTEATNYSIDIAAVNVVGTGTYSTVSNFTTDASPIEDSSIIFGPDTALAYNTGILRANQTGFIVEVHSPSTGILLLRVEDVTTSAAGILQSIQGSALPIAGSIVRVTVIAEDGAICSFLETTE